MAATATSGDDHKSTGVYGTFPTSTPTPTIPGDVSSSRSCARSALTRRASPLSRVFFLWFEYLVDISKTRAIQMEDIWELDDADRSATSYDQFMAHIKTPRDFTKTTMKLYWRLVLQSAVLSLVGAVGDVLNPLLMYIVITAVTNQATSIGFIITLLVARHGIKVVAQIAKQHSHSIESIVAMRTIAALQTLLFDASVSSTWSRDVTASETSNLFYELSAVHQLMRAINSVWLSPLSLAANLYLLYYILGKAVLGSIVAAAVLQLIALLSRRFNERVAQHLHKHQGRRLQIMTECFKTIQSIKLHAWENRFLQKIRRQRKKERSLVRTITLIDACWRSVLIILPELVLAGSFTVLVSMQGDLSFNPAIAFAALSILYRVQSHMGHIIWLMYLMASASVALKQTLKFLENSQRSPRNGASIDLGPEDVTNSGDLKPETTAFKRHHPYSVKIQNAAIGRTDDEPLLVMANLIVPVGSLTVIHGVTGTGKSSLLEAMIDSALILNAPRGSVHVRGRIAYCSQDPWLQTLSIRENILFGLPYNEEKYLNVLHACCLLRDIAALRRGDSTVIGPKGLTLSGGQKARIALARACYADADVYLLDSPLASVDAIVQGDIFRRCIIDLLKHKTIVLVTHNMEVVSSPYVDQVVLVKDYRLHIERGAPLDRPPKAESNRCSLTAETRSLAGTTTRTSTPPIDRPRETTPGRSKLCLIATQSTRLEQEWRQIEIKNDAGKQQKSVSGESVLAPLKSALVYLQLCGGWRLILPFVGLYALSRAALIAGHLWICWWSERAEVQGTESASMRNVEIFLLALGACSAWALVGSTYTLARTSATSDTLFDRMVRGVLFAPMSFFYDQPIGEMMNRFSVDMRLLDEHMDYIVLEAVFTFLGVIMPWLVLTYIMPEMLCVVPVVVWLLYKSRYQLKVALEVHRLEGSSYTPCFDAISEAINGRHVIQAFGPPQVARFRHDHHRHLDQLLQMKHVDSAMHSWSELQFLKVETLLLLVLIAAVFLRRDSLIPLFGLALHYVVTLNSSLCGFHYTVLAWGSGTIKTQRVIDYGSITPEQFDHKATGSLVQLPINWPSKGDIVFDNVSFQYDDLSGPVLQHIQLHIAPGEKIGLVGRTGAGKSSLTMALFRIHELVAGRILIDGVDIALANVYSVRSRLSIIPQSPWFFQGTLRSYLDPFDELDDVALWESLRKTGLATVVTRMDGKLLAQLQENAENLSLGERQLLCLSRVLLKRSRVVVLDEATAAIDHESDEALQRVLKSEFQQATVISIAHRLDSIMAFDRVVVMEDGRIVQCGTVEELVGEANGPFFDLLEGALLNL